MGKTSQYKIENRGKKEPVIHPVWRGIGCIFAILIPVFSYFIAKILVDHRESLSWLIIPREVIINKYEDPYVLVRLIYSALITFLIFLVVSGITYLMNRIFGPSPLGPFDIPPEKVRK